jgi:hypothetical protein
VDPYSFFTDPDPEVDVGGPPWKYALHMFFFVCRTKPERQLAEVGTDRALNAFEIRFAYYVCFVQNEA